eukprot:1374113-Amorphochlora_amoeboformis.AAC.1
MSMKRRRTEAMGSAYPPPLLLVMANSLIPTDVSMAAATRDRLAYVTTVMYQYLDIQISTINFVGQPQDIGTWHARMAVRNMGITEHLDIVRLSI